MSTITRIPFNTGRTFDEITTFALRNMKQGCGCKTCEALAYLEGAEYRDPRGSSMGATYKQLAYIAHQIGMSKNQRIVWYDSSRKLNLSQAHAGTIIVRLRESAKLFDELEEFLSQPQPS